MKIRSLPIFGISLALIASLCSPALGQRTKINVIYPALTGVMTALWVAAESKSLQTENLDPALLYIPSAPQVVRVMLAGDSPIAVSGGTAVINANLSGADFVIVGGITNVPAFYVTVSPDVKSIEDLKGRTVGVTRFGSASDFAMRYVLRKHGLKPDKDVAILQIGGMLELAAALARRSIVAATLSSPADLLAKKAGARVILNMANAGIAFPQSIIVTTRSYLRAHDQEVEAFLKGYFKGVVRMISDKGAARKAIQKYTRETDAEIIDATYQYGLDYITQIPYASKDGVAEILKQSGHPKTKAAQPDDFIDVSVVKRLDDGGFFSQLRQR